MKLIFTSLISLQRGVWVRLSYLCRAACTAFIQRNAVCFRPNFKLNDIGCSKLLSNTHMCNVVTVEAFIYLQSLPILYLSVVLQTRDRNFTLLVSGKFFVHFISNKPKSTDRLSKRLVDRMHMDDTIHIPGRYFHTST